MSEIIKNHELKTKIITIIVLVIIGITFWSMLNFVLLAFIFVFIFYKISEKIQEHLRGNKGNGSISIKIPDAIIIIILYLVFAGILVTVGYRVVPALAVQMSEVANLFMNFDIKTLEGPLGPRLYALVAEINFDQYIDKAAMLITEGVSKVGSFGVDIFLAFILSLLILIEKAVIVKFAKRLESSKISFLYEAVVTFGGSFVHTFGKVMMVQITIAFINAILSTILLGILGMPGVLLLGLMIFALGLIPVAGVIISLIPLSIIAFNTGGVMMVIAVFVMIMIIHAIETYILNPKLMASKTKLPVCLVFIILITGEHYLGVWGLLIGLPIFIFLLDMLEVDCS